MSNNNITQKIVPLLILLGGFCTPAFAGTVYTYSDTFNYRIPADPASTKGPMLDAVINVTDHLTIFDLDIGINLTHSNVFDLQIFLESPSGTRVCLNMYDLDEYFDGEDYIKTIFDDEAEIPISEAGSDLSGRFQPIDPLSAFDGEDAYGLWRLQIYDAYYADIGSLESYNLSITVLEPATAILLIFGVGLAMILRPRRA
jgi:subtilisin-like proprotein convertase family protein